MELLPSLHRSLRILAPQPGSPAEGTIARVIATLDEIDTPWCLIGAHAIGEYVAPRAADDVDLLVDDRRIPKLLARLAENLGPLDTDDIGAAVRLRALQVDLARASSNSVFRTALAEATTIDAWRLPTREALLVMKFMAATSTFRGLDRRRQDIVDLVRHRCGPCDGPRDKSYSDDGARILADDWDGVRDVVYDQETSSHHEIAACVANVDNYVSWLFYRFRAYQFCAVPPGSPLPDDYEGWPDEGWPD